MEDRTRRGFLGLGAGALLGAGSAALTAPSPAYAAEAACSVQNVRDHGAVGDGKADDTLAIQAAVDAALGGASALGVTKVRLASDSVFLPKGAYRITSPIRVYSAHGLRFLGAGEGQTILVVSGQLPAALDLNGLSRCDIEHLTIIGATTNDTADTAVKLDWDPEVAARSTSGVRLNRISVRNLKYVQAFQIGVTPTRQTSEVSLVNCLAFGRWADGESTWWQTGFLFGNGVAGNVLNHWAFACMSLYHRYNYWARSCNTTIVGADTGHGEVDFRQSGDTNFNVRGVRSEQSQRLFEQQGGASYQSATHLEDVIFETTKLHADQRFIVLGYAGATLLTNVAVRHNTAAPRIYLNNGSGFSTQITAIGLRTRSPIGDLWEVAGASAAHVVAIGYTESDATGRESTHVPMWVKRFNNSGLGEKPTFADGILAPQPSYAERWYLAPGGAPGKLALSRGVEHLVPFVARRSTLADIAVEVVSASTGATIRLGLRADTGSGQPGARIADFGTVRGTTVGTKRLAAKATLEIGRLYWLSVTAQGKGVRPVVRSGYESDLLVGDIATTPTKLLSFACYTQAGVAGALPAAYTIGPRQHRHQAPRVGYRYA